MYFSEIGYLTQAACPQHLVHVIHQWLPLVCIQLAHVQMVVGIFPLGAKEFTSGLDQMPQPDHLEKPHEERSNIQSNANNRSDQIVFCIDNHYAEFSEDEARKKSIEENSCSAPNDVVENVKKSNYAQAAPALIIKTLVELAAV
mmetsp:Transcript_84608/g.155099  ORF Transcript_84608/g.155099 Transcript_84608/m.155099 type:complete len:144 (+) Transcript_84608:80-511(+)